MRFAARVYFDLHTPAVWDFYRLLAEAAHSGVDLALDWRPFAAAAAAAEIGALSRFEAVREAAPERHGMFLQAMLAAHHLEGVGFDDPKLIDRVALAARVDLGIVSDPGAHLETVRRSTAGALELGVESVPSLYRDGPVLAVTVNPAATRGDAVKRLEVIDAVLDDDGIWELKKP